MKRSKNEIKEKRGKIGCIIALLIPTIFIGGYFIWLHHIANQFENSLKEPTEKYTNKNYEVKEGRLILNFSEFQSFYGLPDSLVNKWQDTIEHFIKNIKQEEDSKEEIEEYLFLKKKHLLFTPCQFLMIDKQKSRIYFSKEDKDKIDQSDWINKNKKEKKHTFIKMKTTRLKDGIFFCEEILEINQRLLTAEEKNN